MCQFSYNSFKTNTQALEAKKTLDKLTKIRYKFNEIFLTPYIMKQPSSFPSKETLLVAGAFTLVSCGGDGGEPIAPPRTDHAPTTETTLTVDGQNLVINNTNNDIDGDPTSTNIKVTNSQLQEIFNQNFSSKTIQQVLENLPAGTYVVKTVTTSTDKKAEDRDQANIEAPEPVVTTNAELIIHTQNIKEDMPIGTEVIDLNATFTVDGQTKTVAELQALGYEVIFTTDNGTQITIEQLKGLLAQILNVDGENNTNPADKANLVANFTLTVKKNGVVKATQALNLNQKIIDVQNWSPTISSKKLNGQNGNVLVAEHENGTTYKQYTDVKNIYNPNNQEAISSTSVQQFADGGNGKFEAVDLGGWYYPKVITGVHTGKYIDTSRAIETMRYAMSEATTYNNNNNAGASYERANKALGNLVSQLLDDPNAFTEFVHNGRTFITPKEASKIAGLAVVEVMQQQGQTLDPAQ